MNYLILIPALVGITILVVSYFLLNYFMRKDPKKVVQKRVEKIVGGPEPSQPNNNKTTAYKYDEKTSALGLKLFKAGLRAPWAPKAYWAVRIGLALVGIAFVWWLGRRYPEQLLLMQVFVLQFVAAGVGFFLPTFLLSYRINKRKQEISWELPEVLDLLVVCIEAGMGLEQGIARVSDEIATSCPILHSEFRQMSLELLAGKGRTEALRRLAVRADCDDLNSLIAMLVQAETFGTSISQTLRIYSDSLRTKRMQRAEEVAGKLPVKLLIPLILFIFPMLMLILMGPAVIRISKMFIY
ncbi:type II secretion system F family protein [Halodesulfovibrio marinisediminis]|uniref:Tight adherence protein C n=1 Tax=Halodesulfovibrio marinisediminis DSM 17456 TaxID=1121457 RepID=A0A1N6EAD5_9BACT|nr:type II secretion system F family protein [Halodesulfovibrio marinisediminis]SIN79877.1 tight adherence protein C [Halodesulfovibrio marinisediminis DSM 17456]